MSDDNPLRGPSVRGVPEGDNRERMICAECGYILYDNPKIVVGSVARWGERILLFPPLDRTALRVLDPAGRISRAQRTASAGAEREAWEEARARIEIEGLLAIYDIPRISQVQLIYRARLLDEDSRAGQESLEVGLFSGTNPLGEARLPVGAGWALQHEQEARHPRLDRPHQPARLLRRAVRRSFSAGSVRARAVRFLLNGCGTERDLNGASAVIIGASSGIGRGAAIALAGRGGACRFRGPAGGRVARGDGLLRGGRVRNKGRLALAGDTVVGGRRSGDRRRSGGAAAGTPRGTITPSFYACCDNGAVSAGIGSATIEGNLPAP